MSDKSTTPLVRFVSSAHPGLKVKAVLGGVRKLLQFENGILRLPEDEAEEFLGQIKANQNLARNVHILLDEDEAAAEAQAVEHMQQVAAKNAATKGTAHTGNILQAQANVMTAQNPGSEKVKEVAAAITKPAK